MAVAMFGFGAHVLFAPASITSSRYAAVLLIFTPLSFGLLSVAIGLARAFTLAKNGKWPVKGSIIRAILAFCAALIWAQLAVALTQSPTQAPSPGMWVYYALTIAELRSVWRALRDANATRNG